MKADNDTIWDVVNTIKESIWLHVLCEIFLVTCCIYHWGRTFNIDDILKFPLTPVPLSLSHVDGSMVKSPKCAPMKYLKLHITTQAFCIFFYCKPYVLCIFKNIL